MQLGHGLSKTLPVSLTQGVFVIVCGKKCEGNITTGSNLGKHRLTPLDKQDKNVGVYGKDTCREKIHSKVFAMNFK